MEQIAATTFLAFFTVSCVLVTLGLLLAFTEFVVKTVKDIIDIIRRLKSS